MNKDLFSFVEWGMPTWKNYKLILTSFVLVLMSVFANAQSQTLEINCLEDATLECGIDEVVEPEIITENIFGEVLLTFEDVVFDSNPCQTIISRTWMVEADGLVDMCTQLLEFVDTTAPYFLDVPADLQLECIEEVPAPAECIAEDSCDEEVFTEIFTMESGHPVDSCSLSTAYGPGDDWSLWLPGLEELGSIPTDDWHFQEGAYLMTYEDGTAEIHGVIENSGDASMMFEVNLFFENERDWTEWSALGRSYKDDAGIATADMLYENWAYYEMVSDFSRLTGLGALAGSELYLTHSPSTYYFGFQCGEAANNTNGNNGFSGWFHFEGWVDGTYFSEEGDINVDKECYTQPEVTCINDNEFTYMWRAEDDCGNQAFSTQVISVLDTTPPEFTVVAGDLELECDEWPIPVFEGTEAVDNCVSGVESITYIGEFAEEESACYSVYLRRWEAIDFCGNVSEYIQTITVEDTEAPTFDFVPEDLTIQCDEEIPTDMATAIDNCTGATVTVSDVEEGDSCDKTITRTFTAIDGCENVNVAVQTIHIVDTEAPVFDPFEISIIVSCEEVDDVPLLTATDNCNDFEVTYEEFYLSGGCMGVVHRLFTATDICGNTSTAEQFITLLDNTPPTIENPEDQTVECDDVPSTPGADGIEIYDNCGLEVTVEFEETITPGPCVNDYTITWYWYAEDYCGNWSEATSVIHVVDTTDPTWIEETLPQDMTIECDQDLPEVVLPEAEDNCDDDVAVEMTSETFTDGDCPYNYTVQRIFRGTDNCGNEVLYAQNITVQDTTPPALVVGEDVTMECTEPIPAEFYETSDNCGTSTVVVTESSSGDSCDSTITRTYTATDDCLNSTVLIQTIHVVDSTAPSVVAADDMTIDCQDPIPAADYTYSDNCNEGTVAIDEVVSGDDCLTIITRTYVPTDICGNVGEADVQTITIVDTTAPTVTPPADLILECPAVLPEPSYTTSDDCNLVTVEVTETETGDLCETIITRTFVPTDACGNVGEAAIQTITILDTTPPTVVPAPSMTIDCTDEIPEPDYTYSDNCNEGTVDVVVLEEGDSCDMTITRTYTPTDVCGNLGESVVQIIHILDTTPPVVYPAQDLTLDCLDPIPAASYDTSDDCNSVTVEITEEEEGDSCDKTITRYYTPTDACGNVGVTETQTIHILDTTAPTVVAGDDLTIECSDDIPAPDYTAEDDCNEVTVEVIDDYNEEDWCEVILTRTYIPTDLCGNIGEADVQIITIVDTTAPVVDPYEVVVYVNCEDIYEGVFITATDNCHEPIIEYTDVEVSGTCPYQIIRTYTISDMCGNSADAQQIFYLLDDDAPVFDTFPEDATYECNEDLPSAEDGEGEITFSDNCTEAELIYDGFEMIEGDCPQNYQILHTWTVIDECENEDSMTWIITVQDTTNPWIEVGANVTIECTDPIPAPVYEAGDNCDLDVDVVVTEVETGDSCETIITRTYTATDDCENSSAAVQTITIVDTTPPTVDPADDVTIECTDDIPAAAFTTEDNCNTVEVEIVETESGDSCETIITREYTPTDACGNVGETELQIITILDSTAPTVTPAGNVTIECTDEIPAPSYTTDDNCNSVTVNIDESEEGDSCETIITRVYTPTDACGNVGDPMTQVITILDTTPPIIVAAGDETVECDQNLPEPMWEASDACSEFEVVVTSAIAEGACPQEYTMTRTYTATDVCGNSSSDTQVIHVVDTTAPEVVGGPDMTISCTEPVPEPVYEAEDNCSAVDVTVDDVYTGDSCEQILTRTYWAEDDCGNTNSYVQTITIIDNVNPYFTFVPEGGTYECDETLPTTEASADDLCSDVVVTSSEEVIPTDCPEEYTLVITWTAIDACDNFVTETTVYNVYDNTAPIIDAVEDLVLDCDDEVPTPENPDATDNCDTDVSVTSSDEIIGELPDPEAELDCNATNPSNNGIYDYDWAIILLGDMDEDFYTLVEGEFLQYEDGTAHFTGTLQSVAYPGGGFYADIWFENGMDWAEWSTQEFPTNYKDDQDLAGDNYLDWTYYLMNNDLATLNGWGTLAGSMLTLEHAPANHYYAFQIGVAANNVNSNYGGGGWFTFEGVYMNSETGADLLVDGPGDIAWDADCCPEYYIERTYCAVDCAGNETCVTQTITFEDLDGIVGGAPMTSTTIAVVKGDFDIVNVYPNPAFYRTFVDFKSNIDTKLSLDLYDGQGHLVERVFDQNVSATTAYRVNIETGALESGIYTLRLSSNSDYKTSRIVIVR